MKTLFLDAATAGGAVGAAAGVAATASAACSPFTPAYVVVASEVVPASKKSVFAHLPIIAFQCKVIFPKVLRSSHVR